MFQFKRNPPSVFLITLLCAACLSFIGCEISGGDETVRQVALQIAGTYRNESGIASRQSGTAVTALTLLQSGDRLEAIDNLGARWTGSIGRADSSVATVTLRGLTSTGVQVVITGEIRVSGTSAPLSGIWVEPNLRSPANAEATVAATPTPTPEPNPTGTPGPTATPTPEIVLE
jgi:hypothetical protein